MTLAATQGTTQTPTNTTAATRTSATAISSDFETFLRMLTVQMQNQDPLNPIDSTDYAVQLATFSGVEQQVLTNSHLAALASQLSLIGMSQLSGWVGQDALAKGTVSFDGSTPVTLLPQPAARADTAVLVVRDSNGMLVSREEIGTAADPYDWLGASASGDPLPAGLYTLSLESLSGDTVVETSAIASYARITEVRASAGGTVLVLAGGVEITADQVLALRQP